MSKHWNPENELRRLREERVRPEWPEGATAGLAMLAAACIGVAALLYHVAGPRDVIGP